MKKFFNAIEEFFRNQFYQTTRTSIDNGCVFIGRPIDHKQKQVPIMVIITGQPNDFIIDFAPWERKTPPASIEWLGVFGGALDVRDHYKHQDEMIELEKKFWSHATSTVSALKDSSST